MEFRTASAFAARGSAQLEIVLKIMGELEGSTQHISQLNEGSEVPSASRVTVARDGLMDDSVRGERWDITLERTTASLWRIRELRRAWHCWRGEQLDRFATVSCSKRDINMAERNKVYRANSALLTLIMSLAVIS